ncbi:MAG TPA: DUF2085 domain-containing protein [Ktedonobacterales bacterium]|nr:DUF2085 domain-containing protein [Ktedonobacterales bacterium]
MEPESAKQPPRASSQPVELDQHIEGISPRRQAFSRSVVRVAEVCGHFLGRHWLALFESLLGIFIGGAFLGPILAYFGNNAAESWLLHSYHGICDQIPSHSYYLFGHQVCLCERCLAIYSTLFLAGLALAIVPRLRQRARPLDWRLLLLLILPMALDGGTQLMGWRESDLLLRTITGFLFGLGGAWFVLPRIEEVARDPAPQRAAQPLQSLPADASL